MSDEPKKPSRRWLKWSMAIFAMYLLLIGPAALLLSARSWAFAYAPILWTSRHCAPVSVCLELYMSLWIGPPRI